MRRPKTTLTCLCVALWCAGLGPAAAQGSSTSAQRHLEANALILDVRLGASVLTEGLSAYHDGPQILLPLGELARLLTLAIAVDPENGSAQGYVLREDRTFGLSVAQSIANANGRQTSFEAHRARVIGDDIYVSSALLSRWLPIDFEIDLRTLQLHVKPRERLPLQAKLEREQAAARLATRDSPAQDPGYPRQLPPYQLVARPFIDQTLGADARFGRDSRQYQAAYTAYLTADLLGMEAAAYVASSRAEPTPDWRMTLSRNDPDAGLLGPLRARSFVAGNIQVPSVPNVMTTSPTGRGVVVSNRRLDQPTGFDRQSLRGELAPGWDVTLYYNDALVGFQQPRPDGLYAFDDLPLSFGPNEFVLVFNGPLGQTRTERRSFLLDQSVLQPGELLYSLAQHHADNGSMRTLGKFDFGLTRGLVGSAGLIRMPAAPGSSPGADSNVRSYGQLGLRGYWQSMILTSELTAARHGGTLLELGGKTRLGGYAVDLLHTEINGGFDSDVFRATEDPVQRRSRMRALGAVAVGAGLPRLPVALEVQREVLRSGASTDSASGRISATVLGTAFTNAVSWQRAAVQTQVAGSVQISRRVAEVGLSGQLGYSIRPDARVDMMAFTADRNFAAGYRVSGGVLHTFSPSTTVLSGALSRSFGGFAIALSGSYSSKHELAVGLQVFFALGHDPRSSRWFADAVPLSGTGAVSARAFVDRNLNGVRDADEELVANAGFIVNSGGRHPTRTSEDGTVLIGQLTPGRYTDLALDPTTLEDPQWKPVGPGVRTLPRPGVIQMLEFPVATSTDIDGTVYLLDKSRRRGIGNAVVELIDDRGSVIATTKSTSDGFYTLHQVMPGRYTLRISPEQANGLGLRSTLERSIDVASDSDFISGQDLELTQ